MGDGLCLLHLGQQGSVCKQDFRALVATTFQMAVKESLCCCLFLISSFRKKKKWKQEGRENGEK